MKQLLIALFATVSIMAQPVAKTDRIVFLTGTIDEIALSVRDLQKKYSIELGSISYQGGLNGNYDYGKIATLVVIIHNWRNK